MGARAFGGAAMLDARRSDEFSSLRSRICRAVHPAPSAPTSHGTCPRLSSRTYQTTFDGKPGFQTLLLGERYPVYLVDLPWTGRAGKACSRIHVESLEQHLLLVVFVFTNRVGLWVRKILKIGQTVFWAWLFEKTRRCWTSISATSMSSSRAEQC